jgi:methionine aminopeptidase
MHDERDCRSDLVNAVIVCVVPFCITRSLSAAPRVAFPVTNFAACGPGVPFEVIGQIIASGAKQNGFGVSNMNEHLIYITWADVVLCEQVVERFTGHGIGTDMHMYPHVFHVPTGNRLTMQPGITFTIEPMVTAGALS